MAEMLLQPHPARAARAPALQRDIERAISVARSHRRDRGTPNRRPSDGVHPGSANPGLPRRMRKRTNGERFSSCGIRQFSALAAGSIGVGWYIRLEQGRTVNPSASTAVERALRLSKTEHAHLKALARNAIQ
jgi:hypothetical protein